MKTLFNANTPLCSSLHTRVNIKLSWLTVNPTISHSQTLPSGILFQSPLSKIGRLAWPHITLNRGPKPKYRYLKSPLAAGIAIPNYAPPIQRHTSLFCARYKCLSLHSIRVINFVILWRLMQKMVCDAYYYEDILWFLVVLGGHVCICLQPSCICYYCVYIMMFLFSVSFTRPPMSPCGEKTCIFINCGLSL